MKINDVGKLTCVLHRSEVERLLSWLRCYPVVGRENERKSLEALLHMSLSLSERGVKEIKADGSLVTMSLQETCEFRESTQGNKGLGTCQAFAHKHALHTKNTFCENWQKSSFLKPNEEEPLK